MKIIESKADDDLLTEMTERAEPAFDVSVASRDELERLASTSSVKDTEHKRKTCGGKCK